MPNTRTTSTDDLKNLTKTLTKKAVTVGGGNSLKDKLEALDVNVRLHLKDFLDIVEDVRNIDVLKSYIDGAIKNGVVAIDTETTGLDPLTDVIIGVCLYTPNHKAIYVPIRHRSYMTDLVIENQIKPEQIKEELQRLANANTKIIMHNSVFDIRMIKNDLGVYLKCHWDTMICAKLLNNLESAALKFQYMHKIKNKSKTYDFDKLFGDFKGDKFAQVPIKTATPYAATDAYETYELYLWQEVEISKDKGISNVFFNIEMPLVEVVVDIEDTGVGLDLDFAKQLSDRFHKQLDVAEAKVQEEIMKYKNQIDAYNLTVDAKNQLKYPVNPASPKQLAILLYDVIKVRQVSTKEPRGTGEEILAKLDIPLSKAIIETRKINKLLGTYVDKLPEVVNKKTGRIHARFNQVGTDTGRFSSSDPNLQNIPVRGNGAEVRLMFVPKKGNKYLSSDYSLVKLAV